MSSTYDIEGDAYPSSIGNLLAAIFGTDTVSGSSAPYTHTFGTASYPGSLTLSDYYVAGFRQFPGQKLTKLSFKFTPDAGLTYSASFIGFPSASATAPSSQTFGTNPFFLGWEASLSIGGTANAKLNSLTLNLQRKNSEALFSAANSQNPFDIFLGPLAADWDIDFYMEDDSEYTLALNQATKAVSVTLTQPGTGYSITFTSSAVQFTKPTIDRSQEYVQSSLSGSAIYNATDASVVTATLKNGVSTAYTSSAAS
ncbi:phage tail tube protein [Alicyclobacillus fastidiosus]|uniref:Phage tail tube protein n=1 Tax=Alicyclobacillus fastidiosus TaxID=392011 RepID=A0ABV5AKF1_9BACL|nr:phage tail tube protein [Alicyclobacillus fastidiosus]WEH08477.1 phage tail tube protein [Alicyclobacillus fastidiosus]